MTREAGMTREEAIEFGKMWLEIQKDSKDSYTYKFFVMAIEALERQPKTGHWIEKDTTYYEELNKRGLGVDEYTPYFTDDIACSECLAKYSTIDNETQFFKYCPNCGAKME